MNDYEPEEDYEKRYKPNAVVLVAVCLLVLLLSVLKFPPLATALSFGIIFALLTLDLMLQRELR